MCRWALELLPPLDNYEWNASVNMSIEPFCFVNPLFQQIPIITPTVFTRNRKSFILRKILYDPENQLSLSSAVWRTTGEVKLCTFITKNLTWKGCEANMGLPLASSGNSQWHNLPHHTTAVGKARPESVGKNDWWTGLCRKKTQISHGYKPQTNTVLV